MLTVDGVSFHAAGSLLLSGIRLELAEGATLALLGPSGSGKTTLLRLIMGFETLNAGSITWRGRLLSAPGRIAVPPEERHFGMVFQDAALFPHLDVAGNVAFGLRRLPKGERAARVDVWLRRLHLEGMGGRGVQALSGGERQRVALARAFAPEPQLLLLDEPFSNLDRLVRFDLLAELRAVLRETGTTTIFVTHDSRDVVDLDAEFVLIAKGAVARRGRMEEVLRDTRQNHDDWAARFLACGLGLPGRREEAP